MRDRNLLFFEEDLDAQLRARQQRVSGVVDGIPKDQFLISSDQELIDHVVAELTVEPIVLREEATTMNPQETQIDVSSSLSDLTRIRNNIANLLLYMWSYYAYFAGNFQTLRIIISFGQSPTDC